MMTFGSLFAGIGGFDLGLERAGMECRWQVEIDPYCQRVLTKHWPNVKRYGDIRQLHGSYFHPNGESQSTSAVHAEMEIVPNGERTSRILPPVDLLAGGVPCQPASCAGKQKGTADDRWLWPEAFRIVREVKPAWVLFENVSGILTLEQGMVFENLLLEMEAEGYEVQTLIIPACAVDAPHRRDRVWIVGYSEGVLPQRHAYGQRQGESRGGSRWSPEPKLGRRFDGFPAWLDRFIGRGMSHEESLRSVKTLRELWNPHVSQALWKATRGLDAIQQAQVLFSFVCQYQKGSHKTRLLLEGKEVSEDFLRELRRKATASSSSYRSEQGQQQSSEYPDPLQMVPQFPPCDGEANWQRSSWEDGIARVAHGIPHRVDRLKALGNAVVPQLVEVIGRAILKSERNNYDRSV